MSGQLAAVGTAPATAVVDTSGQYLAYLPVGLFGSVMGLTGLSVAWRLAAGLYGAPIWAAGSIGAVAVTAFVLVSIGYLVKLVTAPKIVLTEFRHPIGGSLFGTILISLLLLPIIIAPYSLITAQVMWSAGAVLMVLFAWVIVSRWMSDRQQVAHATPAWIIPVVGLLDVPLALPVLGLPPLHLVMVLGMAVGLFFAIPLFTLIFSRLVFEPPMPDALRPTLLVLIAPFAVGYSTYVLTAGHVDLFAESLYVLTLFILAVLIGQLWHLPVCCPFRLAWWAVSFPLAASAIASLRFAAAEPSLVTDGIGLLLLALATIVIVGLLLRTVVGVLRGELRSLSGA